MLVRVISSGSGRLPGTALARAADMLDELPEGTVDIGNGVHYSKVTISDGTWVGVHVWHRCKDHDGVERWDAGYVAFDVASRTREPKWQVHSYDPLDISPSVLQPDCGFHGFIRQGKWVPA